MTLQNDEYQADAGVKYLDLNAFVDFGFLQEVNRRFFHPLGLALEVTVDDEGVVTELSGIWDYRDDPEGILFAPGVLDREKKARVQELLDSKVQTRRNICGFVIQPLADEGIRTP